MGLLSMGGSRVAEQRGGARKKLRPLMRRRHTMPTEDQRNDRPHRVVRQGVLALMPPFKILATTVGAALLVLGLLFAYASSPAWAAIITVNSLADDADGADGECTLREAITAANDDTASGTATGECAAGSGDDEIHFALPGTAPWTVNLTGALPDLSTNIDILGPGANQFTVRRSDTAVDNFRIFTVTGDTTNVTISGMTISNGNADDGGGGGISNEDNGTLTVTDSTISGNSTDSSGGGIDNNGDGTLTVTGSTISGNTAGVGSNFGDGGGINTFTTTGTVTVTDSTISGNTAASDGGGISNGDDGTVTVTDSTISGNTAGVGSNFGGAGGGIFSDHDGPLTVTSSTISGNTAAAGSDATVGGGEGGGIFSNNDAATTTITNSTISGNTAAGDRAIGGGVYNEDGLTVIEFSTITLNTAADGKGSGVASFCDDQTSTEVLSSIISANTNTDVDFVKSSDDCVVPPDINSFVSNGYNLIGDGNATGAFNQTGDQTGVTDPGLDPLDSYGGPTQTHRLQSDSPAIDAGPPTDGDPIACPPPDTDQRGFERPQDGNADATPTCDIGSFELEEPEDPAPTVTVDGGGSCGAASDMRGTINLTLSDSDDPPESLTLRATSSNRSVLPNSNISFGGGTDASRTMTVSSLTGSGTSNVTITVSDGDLQGTVVVRVISGSAANNTLTGSANSDMIFARKGSDTLSAQGANDLMCGGNGNDRLTGGLGADHFGGGSGTDTATDFNAGEGDTMAGIP
jgi:CSLREA domain-containing protein